MVAALLLPWLGLGLDLGWSLRRAGKSSVFDPADSVLGVTGRFVVNSESRQKPSSRIRAFADHDSNDMTQLRQCPCQCSLNFRKYLFDKEYTPHYGTTRTAKP